jgi:hypothetical protein
VHVHAKPENEILTFFTECFAKSTDLDVMFVGEECDLNSCGNNDGKQQECFAFLSKKYPLSNQYFDVVWIDYLKLNSINATHDGNRRRLGV